MKINAFELTFAFVVLTRALEPLKNTTAEFFVYKYENFCNSRLSHTHRSFYMYLLKERHRIFCRLKFYGAKAAARSVNYQGFR